MSDAEFDRLGRELAAEQDRLREGGQARAKARAEFLEASAPRPAGHARWLWSAVALGFAVAALIAFGPRRTPPLTAALESTGQALSAGAFIEAEGQVALPVRFSDGSRITLSPRARARLVELDGDGAHLLLEGGHAQVAVVPRAHTRFRISAGPFLVRVTGTRFGVAWDAERDRFELDLQKGSVEVAGCVIGQGYAMRSGQRVTASCKRKQFDVGEAGTGAGTRTGAVTGTGTGTGIGTGPGAGTGAGAAPGAGPESAVEVRDVRRVRRAVRPAPVVSFEDACARADAEELTELADSARRSGDFEREGHALRMLRRRFAGTERGALAAFALGRLEFDVYGEHRKAASWFATYVREQPAGALVREARGRLVEAKAVLGETVAAQRLAVAYLRDYPQGPHAELARSLTGEAAP